MKFFNSSDRDVVRLKLARDRTRDIKKGYPWIFADSLAYLPAAKAGSRAMVRDRSGSLLAFGMYDPDSPLAVRILAIEKERLDDALIERRLSDALTIRKNLFDESTTGYRLLNGEGDGLPGLVCDVYGTCAVLKLDGAGPLGFWNLEGVSDWLEKNIQVSTIIYKPRSAEDGAGRVLRGKLKDPLVRFCENGAIFKADVVNGQKSGFFLDQRDNRRRFGQLAKGQRVLNICGYTGGFSVSAGLGGAIEVTTVDIAKPAIAAAEQNWELNGLVSAQHHGVVADAFDFLNAARKDSKRWDLIVVDPPSFAPAERFVAKARDSYQNLFTAALGVLNSRGTIALSSCSSHITPEMFLEICETSVSRAKLRATILGIYGQPEDHPFPLACRELQYLKFVMMNCVS